MLPEYNVNSHCLEMLQVIREKAKLEPLSSYYLM